MDELQKLYGVLNDKGYYTKSFDEFSKKIQDESYKKRVYDVVSENGLYTKDYDSFKSKYSSSISTGEEEVKKKDDFTLGPTDMDLPSEEASSDISPEISKEYEKSSFQAKDYLGEFLGGAIDAGVRQGKTVEETMELIYQGKDVSEEDLQQYVAAVRRMQTDGPSKDMMEFQKIAEENGGGLAGFLMGLKEKPEAAGEVALTSFAGMIATGLDAKSEMALGAGAGTAIGATAGAVAGGGVFTPITAAAGATSGLVAGTMGAAGGLLETSMSYTEFLSEELEKKGLEFNPENIRTILNDDEARDRITNRAIKRGGVIGIVDGMTAGLAGAASKSLVKTAGKTATAAGRAATKAGALATAGTIEAVGGGSGEALARLAVDQEMDITEIGFEAIGGAPKGLITGPVGIIRSGIEGGYTVNGETVNKKRIKKIIDSATPEQLADMNIKIEDDPTTESEYKGKVDRYSMSENLPDDIPAENKEQVIDLELKRKELESKDSVSARAKVKEIESQILELSKPVKQDQTIEQEPVIEQEQVTEQEQTAEQDIEASEIDFATKTNATSRISTDGKFVGVFNKKTGKEITGRKAVIDHQNELIKQRDYTTGKSAFENIPEGAFTGNPSEAIAIESENPQEIARAYEQEKQSEYKDVDPVVEAFVGRYKVTGKSLPDYYGSKDDLGQVLSYLKGEKGKKGMPLDTIAQEVSSEVGFDVSPEQLFGIMMDPKYKSNRLPTQSDLTISLRNKLIEITGLEGTDAQIKAIAEQDPSKLKDPVLSKSEQRSVDLEADKQLREMQQQDLSQEQTQEEAPTQETASPEAPKTRSLFERYKSLGESLRKLKAKIKLDPKRGNVVIRNLQETAKGEVSAEGYVALNTLKQMNEIIGDSAEAKAVADKVLRGQELTVDEAEKHVKLINKANEARVNIDTLSKSLIDLGILPKESAKNIADNIGSYLTRAYEAFENPNFTPTSRSRVKAKNFLLKNPELIQEKAQKESDEKGISFDEALSNQADKFLDSMLETQSGDTFLSREFKLKRGILKKKKDVPKPLREFLGEIESGNEGYYITHLKLSNLYSTAKYQKAILDNGLGKFIFDKKDGNAPSTAQEIKGSAYSILDGYMATPEVIESIIPKQQKTSENPYINALLEINGLVKGWLTVYNPGSYLRNYISTMVMLGVRGDLNSLSGVVEAHKEYKKFWLNQSDVNKKIVEYKKAGIIGQNVESGTVESILNDRLKDPNSALDAAFNGRKKKGVSARNIINQFYKAPFIGEGAKGVADFMQSTFQAGDDLGKIIAYEGRKKFYADALFDKTIDQLTESELSQVTEKASNEIKDQYNNYDRVPPSIKALGRTPIVGSFVQFPAEMIRNSVNLYLSAIDNINSGNPKLKADGIKRIATFTAAQTTLAVGSTILGQQLLQSLNLRDDEDEQKVKDLRNVVAPWSKNSLINVISTGKNKLSYMDMSANNPYAFVSKMIQQGIDRDGAIDTAAGAVMEFFSPFVQEEVLAKALREGLAGKTDSGRPIYYDHDNFVKKGASVIMHMVEAGMPGYVKTVQRLLDEDKSLANEIKSLSGFRTTDVKLDTSIYFKMRGAYKMSQSLQDEYRSKLREGEDVYDDINERYQDTFKNAHEVYMSHMRLGLDSKTALTQIKKSMGKNQKFNKAEIRGITTGVAPRMKVYKPR